ncbi:uncharacterized protein AB675_9633 [Cyphellophora attinorum]|uniref:Nudix hydrolase domain-containing protein n=1 Tax=Cyphellophora attinorum TaxID=1664694 RepID=A0A0N1P1Q0_9EURO|nr:uncharacterized protein AB675_9633 [Phialophora attinorum]KPI42480.1 hypothetical protein AB675_9633 [Phialophora attinorum]
MKHRSVVASFFFGPPSSSEGIARKVALFRRSHHPNVRSYQGKLAPISGSIDHGVDSSPVAAAKREIREETRLDPDRDLRLDFVGPPFSFADEDAGRSWTVHPFGWTLLANEDSIVLDWEHDEWRWYYVGAVLGTADKAGGLLDQCVPRIEQSLRRVYHGPGGIFGRGGIFHPTRPAGEVFCNGMNLLRDDRDNGASVLATNAVRCLKEFAEAYIANESSIYLEDNRRLVGRLRIAGYHLAYNARPSMSAAISSAVVDALDAMSTAMAQEDNRHSANIVESLASSASPQSTLSEPVVESFESGMSRKVRRSDPIVESLASTISRRSRMSEEVCQIFTKYVCQPDRLKDGHVDIVTLSSSSTIEKAFMDLITTASAGHYLIGRAADRAVALPTVINISVLESRPRCEGAALAARLIDFVQRLGPHRSTNPIDNHDTGSKQAKLTVNIKLVPDSHIMGLLLAHETQRSGPSDTSTQQYLILGADRISEDGSVLNKTLSASAAVLAKTLCPDTTEVIVVSDTDKIAPAFISGRAATAANPSDFTDQESKAGEQSADNADAYNGATNKAATQEHTNEQGAVSDVLGAYAATAGFKGADKALLEGTAGVTRAIEGVPGLNMSLTVENSVFEWVSSKYIDTYLTEHGVMDKAEIHERSKAKATLEAKAFDGLYDEISMRAMY